MILITGATGNIGRELTRLLTERGIHEDAAAGLRSAGLPDWLCNYVILLYRSFDQGAGAVVTADVEQVTGRSARDFTDFARDYASLFQGDVDGR